MSKMNFISYLKTLKPEDWNKKARNAWTVKDVVAHLVCWERGDPEAIRQAWETKKPPWWMKTKDYDEFNKSSVEYYKNYTPKELIAEWEKLQRKVKEEIDRIGKDNLRTRPDLFGWLFPKRDTDHYDEHYKQIKSVVEAGRRE